MYKCNGFPVIGVFQLLSPTNLFCAKLFSVFILIQTIGKLKNLVCLDLTENKLEMLPDTIGDLQSVTDLTLSNNALEELPDSIGKVRVYNFLP